MGVPEVDTEKELDAGVIKDKRREEEESTLNTERLADDTASGDEKTEKVQASDESGADAEVATGAEAAANEYPSGMLLVPIITALILTVFLIALDQTIVATAIPRITDEFQTLDKVSWYGSAYFMTCGGFQSTWGKIFKYFPLKLSFLSAIFVFEVGSLVCAVARDPTTLVVGRAVAGLGGAGVATGAFTIIAFSARPEVRPLFAGLVGGTYGVAAVAGPLIGGAFTNSVSWRWCFYINLPIGGLSAALIFIFFRTPSSAKPTEASIKEKLLQMDPLGTALVMGGIIAFILAVQYGGQTDPWNSSVVVGLLVGFFVIAIVFGIWEVYQGERSMLMPRLMKNRAIWSASLYQFFFAGAYFIALYYLPIFFQSIDNTSPIESGVRNLAMIIPITVAILSTGVIMSSTGQAVPIQFVGAALATLGSGLIYTFDVETSTGKWIGYQIIAGLGFGGAWQCAVLIVQANVEPQDISSATAILFFFQTIGGAFGVSAAQSAFINKIISTLATTAPEISPMELIATGATQIRTVFSPEQVPRVIAAYMEGLKVTFAITVAFVGFAFVSTMFAKWKRLPTKSKETPAVAA